MSAQYVFVEYEKNHFKECNFEGFGDIESAEETLRLYEDEDDNLIRKVMYITDFLNAMRKYCNEDQLNRVKQLLNEG